MSVRSCRWWFVVIGCAAGLACPQARGAERTERFDVDPQWEGRNHRAAARAAETVRQDFGYSPTTARAGGRAGEIGGFITPAGEPAYYAATISEVTFDGPLSASGTLACGKEPFHVLVGFFHSESLNEWRTPNTIALRLNGRGDVFFAYVEYCTARWRAGGDSPQSFPVALDAGSGAQRARGVCRG